MSRPLPPSASVARASGGAKLHAPAAARNVDAISALLTKHAPRRGTALEIASGTGEHVTAFSALLPGLHWQPTDVAPERLSSIDAHVAEAGHANVAPAKMLDATAPGWHQAESGKALILLVNLLHLIATDQARTLLREVAGALAPDGCFILYGPFKRDGNLTSEGDRRFDAQLRAADPAIGYKDDLDILAWLADAGLSHIETVEMPANNCAFIARKPGP